MKKKKENRYDREVKEYSFFLILGYIILLTFSYFFHTKLIIHPYVGYSFFMVTIVPLMIITYYFVVQLDYVEKSEKEEMEILKKEFESDMEIAKIIPVVIFGLGIVYSNMYDNKVITLVFPYLACSILFGSLFPFMVRHLIIDESSIDRMIVADELDFISISQYFGLLLAILILPLLYIQKWSKGKSI